MLMACKKNNVDFTYSPEKPRAGQSVTFSNLSSSGEEWDWTFGDGATSASKSPTYTYKRPGTYTVTLKVDKKNSWTATKDITIYDTVPTFVASDSVFVIYKDYTFTANVYNPYGYTIRYDWSLPDGADYAVITDSLPTGKSLHLYFTHPMDAAPIELKMEINGTTELIRKSFEVSDTETNSMVFRNATGDYRQRIFGARAEGVLPDPSAAFVLNAEQDTLQEYNNRIFTRSELASTFPGIEGFKIANRKIYYRAGGLWVAALDGTNRVQIEQNPCSAMTLDLKDNRIYWAVPGEVKYMPLIGSDNNQFVTVPKQLNNLTNVTKIAPDSELK